MAKRVFIFKKQIFFFCLIFSITSLLAWQEIGHISFTSDHTIVAFDVTDVKLLHGPFKEAQERDRHYLLSLRPQRMLTYFRKTAGLDSLVPAYKGWEDRELRGHFPGHYLSACAMMFAATGDVRLKQKADTLVAGLKECQNANKDGYISAFPRSFIDRVENNEQVWAPYYTIHKILAGLLDAHTYTANKTALDVATGMADWIDRRMAALTDRQIQHMLDSTEQGGMNDVLYNLYEKTANAKYLQLAKKFYQVSYFRPLAKKVDSLKGQHSNSYIPNVVGLARDYELTGDRRNREMVEFFWHQITRARRYATGGTSNGEHWGSEPYRMEKELGPASHESCCTYNMLKLTRHLFTWEPKAEYAAYYERALWNGILPTQHPKTAMTMYYVPMASGFYKTFSTPETSFWCCTGTGVENFAKTANSIYFGKGDSLFVNLFIASQLDLPQKGFTLKQETSFPQEQKSVFTFKLQSPAIATIMLRVPEWVTQEYNIMVNGKKVPAKVNNGYASLKRTWKTNDQIVLSLPMKLHTETLPGDNSKIALLYGPIVLAGQLGDSALTNKNQYGHYGPYNDKAVMVPSLSGDSKALSKWVKAVPGKALSFSVATTKGPVEYIPFYQLFDHRYMIYGSVQKDAGSQ